MIRKLLLLALPATLLTAVVCGAAIEGWVRWRWDYRRGTPGFYESDPARIQRLSAGYNGWFAGVPVRINNLGFRDSRDYDVDKRPGTFRILILGDSVTFGHGSLFETTYPYLLEQRLKAWRSAVDWQVWNLGVPGYNTRQELRYLEEVAPTFRPDLVIVGVYPNDFEGNDALPAPALGRRLSSGVQRLMQRHLYSYEFYKRLLLTVRWKLLTDEADRLRLEHLATEGDLLAASTPLVDRPEQRLTDVQYFDNDAVHAFKCFTMHDRNQDGPTNLRSQLEPPSPTMASWLDAVGDLRAFSRTAAFRLVFFVNGAPDECPGLDRYFRAGAVNEDDDLVSVLSEGSLAVSSVPAYLHYRPSEMPFARGHSMGNANRVKADVLFDFLTAHASELIPDP